MPLPLTAAISEPRRRVRGTIGSSSRWRKPACSITAANDRAPRTSQIVVSMLAMPPRENRSSICGDAGVADEAGGHRGVARLRRRSRPCRGSGRRRTPRPRPTAGTGRARRRTAPSRGSTGTAASAASRTRPAAAAAAGSEREMLNAVASAARAASVLTAASGSAARPSRKNSDEADRRAPVRPSRTCSARARPTVRPPPTSFGTRIVVSDSGVILSPK